MFFSLNKTFDGIALRTEKENWSYEKLFEESEKIADAIGGRSLVFLLCTNTPESVAGYVGCINHRIVPAMSDAESDGELLNRLIDLYRPPFIWTPEARSKDFRQYKKIFSLGNYSLLSSEEKKSFNLHEELALLMTTSGSTGSPKFVRLTYKNILSNTESIIEYLKINEQDCAITNLPMHYVYGLSIINTHLYVGASVVVTEKNLFHKEFWQLVREQKVTNLNGVPYTFEMLNRLRFFRTDLPELKTITQAGGKLDPELHKKFAEYAEQQNKKFFVMYGAAEATARMGYLPPEVSLKKFGSMGIAIPGGKFELLDEEGNIIDGENISGELVYHGANVMAGYAESGEDLSKGDEMNGTLRTGDIARRDGEGFYTIVGRKKRFLKMFGKRTNLQETEHILRRHFDISEVACGGVDDKLFIFLTDNSVAENVIPYLSAKLGLHPSAFRVKCIDEIPKNVSGKILYRELEQYYDV